MHVRRILLTLTGVPGRWHMHMHSDRVTMKSCSCRFHEGRSIVACARMHAYVYTCKFKHMHVRIYTRKRMYICMLQTLTDRYRYLIYILQFDDTHSDDIANTH
jgi:hypothetical protein